MSNDRISDGDRYYHQTLSSIITITAIITVSQSKQFNSYLTPLLPSILSTSSPPLPYPTLPYPTPFCLISCLNDHDHYYELGFDKDLNSDTREGFPTRTFSAMASAVLNSCLNCSLSVRILFVYAFSTRDFFFPSAARIAKSMRGRSKE